MRPTTDANGQLGRSSEALWKLVQDETTQGFNHEIKRKSFHFESSSGVSRLAAMKHVPDAAWAFEDAQKYYDIFRYATQKEFELEEKEVLKFNSESIYKSWLISSDAQRQHFVVLIKSPGQHERFPKVGEQCRLIFSNKLPEFRRGKADQGQQFDKYSLINLKERYHKAFRIDNPTNMFSLDLHDCSTFRVSLSSENESENEENHFSSILEDLTCLLDPNDIEPERRRGDWPSIALCDEASFWTHLCMDLSDTTKSIELKALEQAVRADPLGRVGQAFSYIRTFNNSVPVFNLFEAFPHIEELDDDKSQLPESLKKLYRDLDSDQKSVWKNMLSKLPARVGIIPGGTGTGKSKLMMTISALVLAGHPPSSAPSGRRGGPVLFVMEANRLVNDAATRIHQLFKQLGREDLVVVRGYNLNYENAENTRSFLTAEDDDQSARSIFEQWFPARRADHLPQIRAGLTGECPAMTVRDLVRKVFRDSAKDFSYLTAWVSDEWDDDRKRNLDSVIRTEWDRLLRKALPMIDILITTVNGAAKIAPAGGRAFRPRLVIFDEAARAREPSTLAVISFFPSTEAWLFTGTCELSRPYVGSHGNWKQWNPCKIQLRASMMERAQHVVPDMQWLSLNYQIYGNLQELPSKLFWDGKIQSAIPQCDRFPAATRHLLQYFQKFADGHELTVPRLLVHTKRTTKPDPKDKSKYNPHHVKWVVQCLIRDLCQDPQFRSVDGKEPGSITVVTPYRAQLNNYRAAIHQLFEDLDNEHRVSTIHDRGLHREMRVEARSSDTVQSHSADLVVLDLVHCKVTTHIDDPHRLAVSLTRARQAEVIVMHRDMVDSDGWAGSLVEELYQHCHRQGQVVTVDEREQRPAENNYALQQGGFPPGNDLSEVPRQLPALTTSINLSQDNAQAEDCRAVPASDSQPPDPSHNDDDEDMFPSGEAFSFEMVRKAMELGLGSSSDRRKHE